MGIKSTLTAVGCCKKNEYTIALLGLSCHGGHFYIVHRCIEVLIVSFPWQLTQHFPALWKRDCRKEAFMLDPARLLSKLFLLLSNKDLKSVAVKPRLTETMGVG